MTSIKMSAQTYSKGKTVRNRNALISVDFNAGAASLLAGKLVGASIGVRLLYHGMNLH